MAVLIAFTAHSFCCSVLQRSAHPTARVCSRFCACSLAILRLCARCPMLARQHPANFKPSPICPPPPPIPRAVSRSLNLICQLPFNPYSPFTRMALICSLTHLRSFHYCAAIIPLLCCAHSLALLPQSPALSLIRSDVLVHTLLPLRSFTRSIRCDHLITHTSIKQ